MKYTRNLHKGKTSLSFRTIPKSICDQLDLYGGQEIELEVKNEKIIITPLNLDLKPGDKLDFRIDGDHIKVVPVHPSAKMNVQVTATNRE